MKKEFKGTQGQWVVNESAPEHCEYTIISEKKEGEEIDEHVCSHKYWSPSYHEQSIADARLISAAPDLLEVCIVLETVLEPLVNNPTTPEVMQQLKSAISKALINPSKS